MRATIATGLLLLTVLLGALPWYLGGQIQRGYQAQLSAWMPSNTGNQDQQGALVTVRRSSYTRGWFSSQATVTLELGGHACRSTPCPSLLLFSKIYHGPVPFGADHALGEQLQLLRGVVVTTLDAGPLFRSGRFQPGLPALVAYTRLPINGGSGTRVEMPAFGQTLSADSEQFSLTSSGLLGVLDTRPSGQIIGNVEAPQINADGRKRTARIDDLRASTDARSTAFGPVGEWRASVERLRFEETRKPDGRYALDNASAAVRTELDPENLLSGTLDMDLDRMALPGSRIGASHVRLSFERWHAPTLGRLQSTWRAQGQDVDTDTLHASLLLGAAPLLGPGPELRIEELYTATADGVASLSGSVSITPVDASEVTDPAALLTADARLRADEPLVRRWLANEQASLDAGEADELQALIDANVLQRTPDGQIATRLAWTDGALWVNGVRQDSPRQWVESLSGPPPPAPEPPVVAPAQPATPDVTQPEPAPTP